LDNQLPVMPDAPYGRINLQQGIGAFEKEAVAECCA
jgi:hypothetical protein